MTDKLKFDEINKLPMPLMCRFAGCDIWWGVHDIEVQIATVRIDVCGLLEIKDFIEIMEIKDSNNVIHDADDFWVE